VERVYCGLSPKSARGMLCMILESFVDDAESGGNFLPYRQPICRQDGYDDQVLRFKLGQARIYISRKLNNDITLSHVRISKVQLGTDASMRMKLLRCGQP